jgi:hypothetical protein
MDRRTIGGGGGDVTYVYANSLAAVLLNLIDGDARHFIFNDQCPCNIV